MSNVVQFLEAMAHNPKTLSAEDFAAAVANAKLEPAANQALLAGDANALNQLLGGRISMMCLIAPAENDEPKEEEQDGEEEAPDREATSRAA
ncbi:hypothetical protein [Lysobacter solisilvae (ex Woo and Kim 2020)]|uniref:Uncharacterized protein n=1 Tax=Agrilutibacter terrestris TaxID=2865112 RepID=A0A7H0FTX0_9GAMM|nr:hypothetical protein [Lysobacter terrestris]QNP39486.1 hypothetical protein H8B22_08030 [Lysobacter terrestris]